MRPLGASSFRGSYWASYSLTWTAAEDSALFLLPQTKHGQKKGNNNETANENPEEYHTPAVSAHSAWMEVVGWCQSVKKLPLWQKGP